jgi:hypothetical protein
MHDTTYNTSTMASLMYLFSMFFTIFQVIPPFSIALSVSISSFHKKHYFINKFISSAMSATAHGNALTEHQHLNEAVHTSTYISRLIN